VAAALTEAEFGALEAEIYEAALVPELWVDVLERLTRIGGGVGAALWSSRDGNAVWTTSPRMAPITQRFVDGGWGVTNPRYEATVARGLNHANRFFTEADLFDSDSFTRDPFFTDFMLPEGLGWSAQTSVNVPNHDLLALSIERAWKDGPIPEDAIATYDRLRPHLARAALIAARLAFERARTAVEALAHLGFAAASISENGRVLLANGEFETKGGGWTLRGGDRIAIEDERTEAMLADSLRRIGTTGGVRSIPLPPRGAKIDAVIHLVPIRGAAHDLFDRARALVVVTRSSGGKGGPELIQTLFDLTPTEAQIARRLSAGETAEEIARATKKSVLTIRTQLKSVLAKTGTRRQSELVQLLTRLVPPAL
jgi:DNA-binding CsgD family transcriptional regulator